MAADPVFYASGRLSYAVRHGGFSEEELEVLRQELAAAQIEKFMLRKMDEVPLNSEQAQRLCTILMEAASQTVAA